MLKPNFRYVHDLAAAKWIYDNIDESKWERENPLSIFIPKGFESYIAIRHDNARIESEAGLEIDWEIFTKKLLPFTSTPEDCYYGLWEGYGNDYQENHAELFIRTLENGEVERLDRREINTLKFPDGRNFMIFKGKLLDSLNLEFNVPAWMRGTRPNIAWPSDRSWLYFNEIDFEVTLLGGSEKLISSIEHSDLYKTERFLPETLIRDIYLVPPWRYEEIINSLEEGVRRQSLRMKISGLLMNLGFWLRGCD
jgi:hypothetical protein